jgi:hypothetical protein
MHKQIYQVSHTHYVLLSTLHESLHEMRHKGQEFFKYLIFFPSFASEEAINLRIKGLKRKEHILRRKRLFRNFLVLTHLNDAVCNQSLHITHHMDSLTKMVSEMN